MAPTSPADPRLRLGAVLASPAAGGAALIVASVAALLLVNLVPGGAEAYHHLLEAPTGPVLAPKLGPMTAHLWINDGLMALFFLLVGLEIKREWRDGQLAGWDRRVLPFVAAAAGMAVPALFYLAVAGGVPVLRPGWAIPAATDIAFALGGLRLLGARVPASLVLLLTAIAIVDDIGAIVIIAVAYTTSLCWIALAGVAVGLGALAVMRWFGVCIAWPYLLAFPLLWYAVLLSGVHATLAGVLAAMAVPPVLVPRLEHALQPWIALLIMPVFGFANAGVVLPGDMVAGLMAPLPLGIAAGLALGKPVGIFGAIRLAVASGIAAPPERASWWQILGLAMLCGIGFTMSLFIGALAFPGQPALVEEAKMGVLAGSILSAFLGLVLLRFAPGAPRP